MSDKNTTEEVFGVKINTKPELNTELINKMGMRIEDNEIDLSKADFITDETIEQGTLLAKSQLPPLVL